MSLIQAAHKKAQPTFFWESNVVEASSKTETQSSRSPQVNRKQVKGHLHADWSNYVMIKGVWCFIMG